MTVKLSTSINVDFVHLFIKANVTHNGRKENGSIFVLIFWGRFGLMYSNILNRQFKTQFTRPLLVFAKQQWITSINLE